MLRTVIGVVLGYVAMSIALFLLFSILYTVLGTSGAFQPNSYDVSVSWIVAGFVIFFVAAAFAGLVTVAIAKNVTAAYWLGGIIFILGLVMAITQALHIGEPFRPEGDVALLDAMNLALQPVWVTVINPFLGFLGAITGGRLKGDQ